MSKSFRVLYLEVRGFVSKQAETKGEGGGGWGEDMTP